jgi:hypothetical protein
MERAGDDSAVDDSDSAATNKKCCRDDMKVNLRELKGFEFIVEPKEFNAFVCRGRCPPRYHPLTEHSLLQSVMHMKHSEKGTSLNALVFSLRFQLFGILLGL